MKNVQEILLLTVSFLTKDLCIEQRCSHVFDGGHKAYM